MVDNYLQDYFGLNPLSKSCEKTRRFESVIICSLHQVRALTKDRKYSTKIAQTNRLLYSPARSGPEGKGRYTSPLASILIGPRAWRVTGHACSVARRKVTTWRQAKSNGLGTRGRAGRQHGAQKHKCSELPDKMNQELLQD